jgi:hypothetical protein
MLGRARRKVLVVAMSLPFWMFFRSLIRAVGSFLHEGLARKLANALPLGVTVPGLTKGSERLDGNSTDENGEVNFFFQLLKKEFYSPPPIIYVQIKSRNRKMRERPLPKTICLVGGSDSPKI